VIAFLDSNALIYYFEGTQPHRQAVIDVLQAIKREAPGAQVAVSRLAVMECCAKPLRDGDRALLANYAAFFEQVSIVELSAAVVTLATDLRASTGLKTPDCLQAACALSLGSSCRFVTADAGFKLVQGLSIALISLSPSGSV
jgi:predicted nucleic acid-binding protein